MTLEKRTKKLDLLHFNGKGILVLGSADGWHLIRTRQWHSSYHRSSNDTNTTVLQARPLKAAFYLNGYNCDVVFVACDSKDSWSQLLMLILVLMSLMKHEKCPCG